MALPPRRIGPHLSAHTRSEQAKYRYLNGDTKHPCEFKACLQCGKESWIQTRLTFCSRRCAMLGENSSSWVGDQVKYSGAHQRVHQARGLASAQSCELCGRPAREWAQTHGTSGLDPHADYRALCKSCHGKYDNPRHSHCKQGHLMHQSKSGKSWYCLVCTNARSAKYASN